MDGIAHLLSHCVACLRMKFREDGQTLAYGETGEHEVFVCGDCLQLYAEAGDTANQAAERAIAATRWAIRPRGRRGKRYRVREPQARDRGFRRGMVLADEG